MSNRLSGGELFDRIAQEDSRMSEQQAANYMRQICEGVQHMHERCFVHLDLGSTIRGSTVASLILKALSRVNCCK